MLLFCPSCSNILIVTTLPSTQCSPSDLAAGAGEKNRFECRTCPYQMLLDRRYFERKTFESKAIEDVLGGADSWANVDKTPIQCPRDGCDGGEAFFKQAQLRSADEPMTTFYKCVKCGYDFRE
ncbi:DNA-directed RNA polymerase III subunit RPC10 [Neohortaea acidophila]|uniref:DNA-directed RNA polymerase subunit n=1 Tax=Neohortaea acidophila TaxID=245834 RepID=A0A6A6PWT6_9PEZI|nr:DNA-directed RNA polymerase III subunit RPC10 [Neohortaea acidophila]KAF2484216.1 DNA-directed RNA polymerase III subunit RPC10 [Neohortaea acidophila]